MKEMIKGRVLMSNTIGPAKRSVLRRLLLVFPLVIFAFVALTVGMLASRTIKQPYETPFFHLFFSDTLHMKVWLITIVLVLGVGQVLTASRIYGLLRFPPQGRFYNLMHRWSGRTAIGLSLPVAYHCIFLLGFGTYDTRVFIHSLLGSSIYGAFLAKVFIVRSKGFPGWALPIAGGLLFSILLGLWLTSAFWFFRSFGFGI
jgi:Family of unknown function (DUF6529)